MPYFVYPLLSLVIDFICLLMCIKFIFSKRGGVWVVPVLLSLVFLSASALCLLAQTSTKAEESILVFARALSIYFLGASAIWLLVIILFRIALNPGAIQSVKSKRNKAESDFLKTHAKSKDFWQEADISEPVVHKIKQSQPKSAEQEKSKLKIYVDPYKEVRTVSPRRYQNHEK